MITNASVKNYYYKDDIDYYADTQAELEAWDTSSVFHASKVYVIETGKTMILGGDGSWAEYVENGSGGSSNLPEVDSDDNGKVLSVVDGEWDKAMPSKDYSVTRTRTTIIPPQTNTIVAETHEGQTYYRSENPITNINEEFLANLFDDESDDTRKIFALTGSLKINDEKVDGYITVEPSQITEDRYDFRIDTAFWKVTCPSPLNAYYLIFYPPQPDYEPSFEANDTLFIEAYYDTKTIDAEDDFKDAVKNNSDVFVINAVTTPVYTEEKTFWEISCDKTAAQIYDAWSNGKLPIVKVSGEDYIDEGYPQILQMQSGDYEDGDYYLYFYGAWIMPDPDKGTIENIFAAKLRIQNDWYELSIGNQPFSSNSFDPSALVVTFPYLDEGVPRVGDKTYGEIWEAVENGQPIWAMIYSAEDERYIPVWVRRGLEQNSNDYWYSLVPSYDTAMGFFDIGAETDFPTENLNQE